MRSKFRPTLAVFVLGAVSVLVLPASPAQSQEDQTSPDSLGIDVRQEVKTPLVADGVGGPDLASPLGSPSAIPLDGAGSGQQHHGRGNVQVSRDQVPAEEFRSGASETAVTETAGGRKLVAGWNDAEGFDHAPFNPDNPPLGLSGYAYSTNRGRTWTDGGAPPIGTDIGLGPGPVGNSETGEYVTRGDPWLDDGDGNVHYANLAVWGDEDLSSGVPAGISVHTGRFRGRNFSWNDSVLLQSPNYPNDFLDKEAMVADGDAIYVTTTNFEETCGIAAFGWGTIELYGSTDGGSSWDRTIIQPDETFITDPADPGCGADGVVNQGSAPAVGPNGELYVVWERGWFAPSNGGSELDRATIAFSASTDEGASFGPRVEVASICSMAANPPAAYNRGSSNDFPRIDVAQSGPHEGRIYVTYHDCSAASGSAPFGADTDVYVTYSDDGGTSWSEPAPLHQTADGKQQFWPSVSTGRGGVVDVTYYEMEDVNVTSDPNDIECSVRIGGTLEEPELKESTETTFSDLYWVRSRDGGATWGDPVRLSDQTTNWCAATPINSVIPNFGDYNTSITSRGDVMAIWADGRNGGLSDVVPTAWFARKGHRR